MICLTTNRLIIRDYTIEDAHSYHLLKSDVQTMYYLQDIQTFTEAESLLDLQEVCKDSVKEDRMFYFLHIEDKNTHEQIGSIGYTVIDSTIQGKNVHVGYFIYPRYWNQGYVSEALCEVMRFAFEENTVYRMQTGCLQENAASEKVMRKCGMVLEAQRDYWQMHNGAMKTRMEYVLTKEDWEQQQRKA